MRCSQAGLLTSPLFPVSLASLADALNAGSAARGGPALRRPWVVVLWSLLFFPVAYGLLQASMNRAMGDPTREALESRPAGSDHPW
jgi:hypothetical protein